MENQPWQYNADKPTETITCPYCEQQITGDALHLMAHGIACRLQWENNLKQISKQNTSDAK